MFLIGAIKRLWVSACFCFYTDDTQTELEKNRLNYALTQPIRAGKNSRRASFATAASDALKAFETADANHDGRLQAAEVMKLEGISDASASTRVKRLLEVFDEGVGDKRGGVDKDHFQTMHYRMNKTAQVMMNQGETAAAKGELLLLCNALGHASNVTPSTCTSRRHSPLNLHSPLWPKRRSSHPRGATA